MPGEKVLIHAAAGGLGTALIQIALWKGCTVIGVAGGQAKADYLQKIGVQHVINHHHVSYLDYVHKNLEGRVDVIFDNIGGSSIKKSKSILANGGRIVSLGAAALSGRKGIINLLRLVWGFGFFSPISYLGKSQSLIGVNMLQIGDHRPDMLEKSFAGVAQLFKEGIFKPHVGRIYSQNELDQAQTFMEERNAIGKIVVKWD
jgi:NADPH2:quinone reductase